MSRVAQFFALMALAQAEQPPELLEWMNSDEETERFNKEMEKYASHTGPETSDAQQVSSGNAPTGSRVRGEST